MASADQPWTGPVPLFPLPNVVLLPHAILPLHIFEPRYRAMVRHALAGERLVGMALLRPGWEADYAGQPPIHDTVCVGRLLAHDPLPDGRSNVLLQGLCRARCEGERLHADGFRLGTLTLVPESHGDPACAAQLREQLLALLHGPEHAAHVAGHAVPDLLGPHLTLDLLTDLTAFHLLVDRAQQQALLAEPDAIRRGSQLLAWLPAALAELQARRARAAAAPQTPGGILPGQGPWPPAPSLN